MLATLLASSRIRVGLHTTSKSAVLADLVDLAATSEAVRDADRLLEAIEAREARLSTGVGQGIAFPHARTGAVTETVVVFATLAEPVDFESLDGEPVRLVLLLAGPEREPKGHLRLLSRASRLFSDPAIRERLLEAGAPDEVLEVFTEAETALV